MKQWLLCAVVLVCGGCTAVPRTEDALPPDVREQPQNYIVVTVRDDADPVSARAGSTPRGYEGRSYGPSAYARAAMRSIASTYRLRAVSGWPINELGVHCVVFQVQTNMLARDVIQLLQSDSRVESVQPLNVFATRSAAYNDPYQSLQSNLHDMSIAGAHRWSRGAGVHVAVIDTGADGSHPDLAGRVVEERNFVDDDMVGFAQDRHGTAIAGVIAADSNNSIGIVGVAPEARLHIYKACWEPDAASAGAACNTFTLAKGLAAAIAARVQIVNLSLAGPEDSLLTRLVNRGQERGLIFVGAIDSSSGSPEQLREFPAGIPGVLKVASSGTQVFRTDALHAPGTDVLTLVPQGRYDFLSGNSLATAGVTGTVALLLSIDRTMRAERLQDLLSNSGTALHAAIDACAALAAALREPVCQHPVTAE